MTKTIVYPGTFDPIHYGHIDIIKRIAEQYDEVVIGVAKDTGDKTPCLSFQERIALTTSVISSLNLTNIRVLGFSGLLADFVRSQGSTAIVRGVRNEKDIAAESIISNVTRSALVSGLFQPSIEVICLMTDPAFKDISSTKIRELAKANLDFSHLVPVDVVNKMKNVHIANTTKEHTDSVGWKYKATNSAINFWNTHKETIAAATTSAAVGFYLGKMN